MPNAKKRPRGPDLRPRLKPGQVRCTKCSELLEKNRGVVLNGHPFHIPCFGRALDYAGRVVRQFAREVRS